MNRAGHPRAHRGGTTGPEPEHGPISPSGVSSASVGELINHALANPTPELATHLAYCAAIRDAMIEVTLRMARGMS